MASQSKKNSVDYWEQKNPDGSVSHIKKGHDAVWDDNLKKYVSGQKRAQKQELNINNGKGLDENAKA